MLEAFIDDNAGLAELLSEVSDASRLRNGIQYFTGTLYILAAAGIEKVFLMVDQLEDLGKKGALSATRREAVVSWLREHGARPAAYISMA